MMKAKYIYEKFTQDTDPIKDMGIGLSQIIADAPKNIFLEDAKHLYLDTPGNIRNIEILADNFIIYFWWDTFRDPKTKKIIQKLKYASKLVAKVGISRCFSSINYHTNDYHVYFRIKTEYKKYFKNSYYSDTQFKV